ncbi:MAG: carboxypeptidase-like regulatory domain-containing protein [Bacteroidota bacterium]
MPKSTLYWTIYVFIIFILACRNDSPITDTDLEPTPPVITIESAVLGSVTDPAGNALEGALLTLGNSQTTSDENGYFQLTGTTDEANAIIKVEKMGYFDAWHAFEPFANDIARTKIRLTPRTNPFNLDAGQGGEITFENAKVDFSSGGFIDENGNEYTGSVSIYTTYLDPTDPDLHTFMPGNLTGFNAENRLQLLQTFGMINVELEGENGQALQISESATIEMKVPGSLIGQAPATIPLWYFDEDRQRWVEEGSATLQGDTYVGLVSHFSFWNCDVPNDFINLSGRAFLGESGSSLRVCITDIENNDRRCTQTSVNDGYFEGGVPNDALLLLEFFAECGDPVFSETIGPFSNDATVGPYELDVTHDWAVVRGQVVNCEGNPVTYGYVLAKWNSSLSGAFSLNESGEFSVYINTCGDTDITLRAVDSENLKTGDQVTFQLTADLDAGTLEACENDIVTGLYYNYNGTSYVVPNAIVTDLPDAPINNFPYYGFEAIDDQGNGNIIFHRIGLLEFSEGEFLYGVEDSIVGSPDIHISVTAHPILFQGENIFLIENGRQSGELVIFEIEDVLINAYGIDYPGSSIRVVGLIE